MIAVCVSGIIGENYKVIVDRARSIFPYPIFFSTWNGRPLPELENLYTFDEPNFEYHPMLDVAAPVSYTHLTLPTMDSV